MSFEINEGEFIAIVGPSGCGKTTLLSLISGILKPTHGKILLKGKEISGVNSNVSYMLQRDHLFEWRTIKKNILLGLEIQKKLNDNTISRIENLLEKVDTLIIGGGMAYTFFKAKGLNIGTSICEEDKIDLAKSLLEKAKAKGVKLLLPVDNKVAKEFSNEAEYIEVSSEEIPDGYMGMDIGAKTIENFKEVLKDAKTVVWNGPLGVFEFDKFAQGTNEVAKILGNLDAITIIGGGDSAAAIEKMGLADKMTHISTGGGASLEFLEGKGLPGIDCLENK